MTKKELWNNFYSDNECLKYSICNFCGCIASECLFIYVWRKKDFKLNSIYICKKCFIGEK